MEPEEFRGQDDSKRPLTDEGIQKMTKTAQGIKKLGIGFDEILSSPYLRAKHTAEIVHQVLGIKKPIQFFNELTPQARFEDFKKILKNFRELENVLIVGHQPSIGMFVGRLIANAEVSIDFRKGALCCVELLIVSEPFRGELKWYLNSSHLRSIN